MAPRHPGVSLRKTILLRVLLLVGGSSLVVTLGFIALGLLPVLERVAASEFQLATERVEARLRQTFEPYERLLEISAGWFGGRAPDVDDPAQFNRYFMPLLSASPHVTSVVAGTSSGQGWMLLQQADGGWRNRLTDIPGRGALQHFIDIAGDGRATSRWERVDYDPRSRPWFVGAASRASPGSVHWTRPYTFFTTGDPGITVSLRNTLSDGRDFVIGFDLMLRDLSLTTIGARVGERGMALIITDDGLVLGLPNRPEGLSAAAWFKRVLQPAGALGVDVVSAAVAEWSHADGESFRVRRFVSGDERWLLSAQPYALGAQSLWVLAFAPASDFAPRWWTLALALGGGLVLVLSTAAIVAHAQARNIAEPLETLAESSKRIGALDFNPVVPVSSPIAEIAQLAQAQESMREMLQRNQMALRDHAERLNAQVRELKDAEDRINTLAFFDPLTGLPNRRLLGDRLQRALTHSTRSGQRGALLFLDLDNFKTLNDTLGHDLGDLLLKEVARRLLAAVREGDTVARLGGDEFVVIVEGLSAQEDAATLQTKAIGAKILESLNQPYGLGGNQAVSAASIGATLFAGHDTGIDELFKQADLAMYHAKSDGRNRMSFFGLSMQTRLSERAALEADLRDALALGQLSLHFQPQVSAAGRWLGVEALLRWQHPQRGMVSPLSFIGVAEESGLILEIGHWVLCSACNHLAAWANVPALAPLAVSVNVSARQFHHPEFCDEVMTALSQAGARPELLRLELTESLLLEDAETVIARMRALRERGVRFSLDDFGTGYSSLSYLKRLPLTELKIDKSFVRDVLIDPNDAAIAQTVIALGHTMGLSVIAEGVETEAQRDFLAQAGCDAYQGYLFGRPMPAADIEAAARRASEA